MSTENEESKQPDLANGEAVQAIPSPALRHRGFAKFVTFLSKVVDPLDNYSSVIAGTSLTAMMFLIFIDVFGRYLLHKPIAGANELTQFMMAVIIGFALSYCALKKGHIRVDLVLQYVSKKANQWFDVFTYAFDFILYVFVTWQAWQYAFQQKASGLTSVILYIPVYPFVFVLTVSMALVTLVFIRDLLESIEKVLE